MRLICIGDSEKNLDGRPCSALSEAISLGEIYLRICGREGAVGAIRESPIDIAVIQQTAPNPRLLRVLRNNKVSSPVLIIARNINADSVADVLAAGADDCVSINIEAVELLARLRAIVRRVSGVGITSQMITIGRMKLNEDTREVLIDDEAITLTQVEYKIMSLFAHRKGGILNKDAIMSHVYAGKNLPQSKSIDVMMCRVRAKLVEKGIKAPFKTIWGVGYRLVEEAFAPLGSRDMNPDPHPHHSSNESCMPITPGIDISAPSKGFDIK